MNKLLLSAGLLIASFSSQAQCIPQETLNEDFTTFTDSALPQNCWSKITTGPMVTIDTTEDETDKYVSFYSFMFANTAAYVVTPQFTSIDGEKVLTFDANIQAGSAPGTITVQPGTLANPADAATFTAVGAPIVITATETTYTVPFAASAATYIALQITASGQHVATEIDNIVFVDPCPAVNTLNEDFTAFAGSALPQNCWAKITTGPMVTIDATEDETDKYVSFYSFMFANTAAYVVTPELTAIDGEKVLTFDANIQAGSAPGTITIQPGTLANPSDATSFTAVGAPVVITATETGYTVPFAATADKYIAFQITASGQHVAAEIDNITFVDPCPAVETLNEDFTAFTGSALPQNCWAKITTGPMVTIDATEDESDKYVSFYSFMFANTAAYVVTPELTAIDGNKTLTFDANIQAGSAPGTITVQPGTLANPADAATFTAVGAPITLTATETGYSVPFDASANKYIAFQITASGQHVAAEIDNIQYDTTSGTGNITKTNVFSIYPNPASDKNVTVALSNGQSANVAIYSLTGAKVFEAQMGNTVQNLNLSALSSGMYIVKVQSGNASASKKLVIK